MYILLMPVEAKRFPQLTKIAKDTLGISGFQQGREDQAKSGLTTGNEIFSGAIDAFLQIGAPLTYHDLDTLFHNPDAKPSPVHAVLAMAIDVGMLGAVLGIAQLAGPEAAVGAKLAYNASASAIPDVAKSVSTRIRSARGGAR